MALLPAPGWSNLPACSTLRAMAGKLSPRAQAKLATLKAATDKVHHVHGLVERYAAVRDPQQAQQLNQPLKRAFRQLKVDLLVEGLDTMSELAGSMEIAAGRGGSRRQKIRILREGVGSLRFQIEQAQRNVVAEDEAEAEREKREAERQAEQKEDD
ncbi:MAG: hypothetical protein GWM90_28400 [Gemmatimonadetes bacterium]|nr:hypothetical protein [Gemmatimonadota bacterium]NIQ58953.1 hypothetical protein [Gemmatimonadota bacterium]NIU79143.1 hypothetical protein [Gammaproteobacteria bacterium]NIX47848.1 hypothetical protein [Gemmatimonadota bacterium]NIY12213.1 hypothetical protein [Gemmatimonadota bacterium]